MSIYQNQKSFIPAPVDLPISSKELSRNLDKFYTKPEIARQCVADFESWTGINLNTTKTDILEPSAGAGAFLDFLPSRTLAYDLLPEDPRIAQQDFLKLERRTPAIVIGNPPFGRSCCLAIQFFNHAVTFADQIAFIVPRTFEKVSIQNRLAPQFHLLEKRVLECDSFTFEGKSHPVPCVFQVWQRSENLRPKIKLRTEHPDFKFVARADADFAVQRVGSRAGAVKENFENLVETTHYFIRANIPVQEQLALFREIDFSEVKARTAGQASVAKTEIVALYSELKANSR
ncbi:SAM-dependent methyltransferase [Sulfitobacter sp. M220]|jgi:hypothetical protein|uniref:hypothetical protein n=1 Tax=Sulfitobacter TaxID=60136 RepID=UPI000C6A2105|nr:MULTISPECIES: hypothetical protein [unclassified Sulfitobacter]MBV48499.1 SAM-dependent methyltransferase [Roseobacter sp.]MCF7726630.1 SAM-dependent methyltransferase [Sulfitobacter sp. M22]MCF7777972.1 SAM-dependent methyltransferase [Sulfitobacter sp. M220]|tara:strand:- start:1898 stop:2761 length:864 start_codon:yes stop_codon:yes gene_type:complete